MSKKEQDYHRQVEDLRAVAQTQSVHVVAEISEKISGVRTNQELGLRICREMMDRQGGSLRVERLPRGGTCVRIRLKDVSNVAPVSCS